MTIDQAKSTIEQVLASFKGNLQEHKIIQEAFQILTQENPTKKGEKNEK